MTRAHHIAVMCATVVLLVVAGQTQLLHADTSVPAVPSADASLQDQINANNAQLQALQNKIDTYQHQLDTLGVEKKTLQDAINALTITQQKLSAQMQVTQNKISSAALQIKQVSQSIGDKESTIVENTQAMAKTLRAIDQTEATPTIGLFFSSRSIRDAWRVADQGIQLNRALLTDIADLRATKETLSTSRDDLSRTKATLLSLQQDLSSQKQSVVASKNAEQDLLKATKNQESNYQKLLADAKAELESFSTFAQNAGGSKLLANQTSCDTWGCYYSQRDVRWGAQRLNNTRFTLASDGCLITAMAMVLTHYGHPNVTPLTINSNPSNFASYYPAYLLYTIYVDGATASRKTAAIDRTLDGGDPVVVGVRAYGGTHYVVITSGSRGNYLMRDPYIANGKDISFTAHYSVNAIFGVSKVTVSS